MQLKFTIFVLGSLFLAHFAFAAPPLAEQQALRDFFDAIPKLANVVNWFEPGYDPETICSDFLSISCTNDSITEIFLPYSFMTGFIPNSIGNLTKLETFRIDGNRLNGTIPASMASLPLKMFRIEGNLFESPFPASLVGIQTLEEVSLQGTRFRQPWPSSWSRSMRILDLTSVGFIGELPASIKDMANLSVLSLSYNPNTFNGTAPAFLFSMSSLEELYLSSNSLTSALPSLCNLTRLRKFDAGQSAFANYALPELGCLSSITHFECRACNLTGTLPTGLLPQNLEYLHLDGNGLTGPIPPTFALRAWKSLLLGYNDLDGTVPPPLWSSLTLEIFQLSGNAKLRGSIPSGVVPASLKRLDLSYTSFFGPIPSDIGNWRSLEEVNLNYSPLLNGSLPASIGNLRNLRRINLSYCSGLLGPLPSSVGTLQLTQLYLSNTTISAGSSSLNTIFNISSLEILEIANSDITGTIPESLGNLVRLKSLILFGNQLTGPLPASISNLRNLEALDIRANQLNGSIPASLSYIIEPTVVYLSSNRFTGCFDQPTVISDPEKCDIDTTLCGCTRAGCKVPLCPSTASSVCVGAKPVTTADCRNGIWVVPSTITVSGGQVTIQNPTLIGGDLVILTSNSTLSLSPTSSRPDLSVAGCVSFNGTLVVNLNSSLFSNASRVDLLTHSGYCGGSATSFASVNIQVDCGAINGAALDYQARSLSLAFASFDSSACNSNGIGANSQNLALIIGCSVAGGVVLLVIITLVVAFNVPAVSNKLMPWRARRKISIQHDEL